MDTIFFSKENYRRIRDIINVTTKEKFGFSVRKSECKKKIINIMKFLYSTRMNMNLPQNMSDFDKSTYLSQKTITIFLAREKKIKNNVLKTSQKTDMRPEVILKKDNVSITKDLDKLMEMREPPKQRREQIDFRDKTNEFDDINIQNRFESVTKERELEYAHMNPNNQSEMEHNSDNDIDMTPDTLDMNSLMNNYQSLDFGDDSDTGNNNFDLMAQFQTITESDDVVASNQDNYIAPPPDTNDKKEESELLTKEKYSDIFKKEMTQLFYGLQDTTNLKTNTYDITLDTRDAPGLAGAVPPLSRYEIDISFTGKLENSSSTTLYVPNNLRNIHSIKFKRLIINTATSSSGHVPQTINDQPFLYVQMENYDSNVITSNDTLNNIFAKIYYDATVPYINDPPVPDSGYMHFINLDNNEKIFKTPLVKLDKMKLKLLKSDGTPIDDLGGELNIVYILEVKTLENYIPRLEYNLSN